MPDASGTDHPSLGQPPIASPTGPSMENRHGLDGRLGFCLLVILVHSGHAAPQQREFTPINTHAAQGFTNLCAKKHSFRRAQRQALHQGSALYRGRLMTDRQLGVTWTAPPRRRRPNTVPQE